MDPIIKRSHDVEGFVTIDQTLKLHYELYLPTYSDQNRPKVLMIMGAFATAVHFANEARFLADKGYEVCIYDHRGVSRSGPARREQQTAEMLAHDAVVLIDAVWGPTTPVHIYGGSMGGMVAQELAVLLLSQDRLLSLGLAVTCRGLKPLGGILNPIFKPQVLKLILQTWYWDNRPSIVRRLMRLVLSRNLLDMMHPSGETYEAVYYREWLANFEDYWTLKDHTVGACHACVCLTHYLSERKVEMLRDSGVPILCQVSARDLLIPPAMQLDLASQLKARTVTFSTGHMGMHPWKDRYHNMLLEQFAMGDVLRAIRLAESSRAMLRQPQLRLSTAAVEASQLLLSNPNTDGSFSDTSSAGSDDQSTNLLFGGDAVLEVEVVLSAELSSQVDESSSDLAVDVTEWSGSDSSGTSSSDCCCNQMNQTCHGDGDGEGGFLRATLSAADSGRLSTCGVTMQA